MKITLHKRWNGIFQSQTSISYQTKIDRKSKLVERELRNLTERRRKPQNPIGLGMRSRFRSVLGKNKKLIRNFLW